MVCLDTDILIGLLRGNGDAARYLAQAQIRGEAICTTIFNEYELWGGAFLRSQKEVAAVASLLTALPVLQADSKTARNFGKISAELIRRGQEVPDFEVMASTIALAHNEPMVTRNEKHFSKIPRLTVIKW